MLKVKIITSPITERMVKAGDEALLDFIRNKIRVGANWFDFDERWIVE